MLLGRTRTRLLGCTCSRRQLTRAASSSSPPASYAYPVPSTSKLPPAPTELAQFEDLIPPETALPLGKPLHGRRPLKFEKSRRTPPPLPASFPPAPPPARYKANRADISPYLPLITRERNYLISLLRHHLYNPNPVPPDVVWQALVALLQYPSVIPDLPPSHYPSSELLESDGLANARRPIQLSLMELRRTFTLLARSRPRTRTALSRLLVVVELLAMREIKNLPPPDSNTATVGNEPGGKDSVIGELRGGGVGLRSKDWEALIQFAAKLLRLPRGTVEVASAVSLFGQWARINSMRSGGVAPVPTASLYNALLDVAVKSRTWPLFEGIEERMKAEGVQGDVATLGLRLRKEDAKGAYIARIWSVFEEGLSILYDKHHRIAEDKDLKLWAPLWDTMLWILARRGLFDDAQRIYEARRSSSSIPIPIGSLSPTNEISPAPLIRSTYPVLLPPPTEITYTLLIQSYAYRGELKSALAVLRDMATFAPPLYQSFNPSNHIFMCFFRGFATYGEAPPDSDSGYAIDPLLLSGRRVSPNSISRLPTNSTLTALRRLPSTAVVNQWTLPVLESLFRNFLALQPPYTPNSQLPFSGQRTSPSTRQLFWLVLAFEKLSGGDSGLVLRVWEEVERTFGGAEEEEEEREEREREQRGRKWTGWRVDKRLQRRLDGLRKALEEEREYRRLRGL